MRIRVHLMFCLFLFIALSLFGIVRIGITAIIDHPALDAIRLGIIDGLIQDGLVLAQDFDFEFQSAQGNMSTALAIANHFNTDAFDIIVAISTPSAQACANVIKSKPVVFSAATDPVAAGLITALGKNPGNVVGVSDMTPVKTQIQLMQWVIPGLKRIGIMTNPGEANSTVLKEHAQAACSELGLELIEVVGTNTSEMIAALSAIVSTIDAIYIGTDNTAASCIESLHRIAIAQKKPIVCADISMSRSGGLIGYGFDYYAFGIDTSHIVSDIIRGKAPSEIESRLIGPDSLQLLINLDYAAHIGLKIPETLLQRASFIIENGVERELK
ncbi:MAG TPA: ABC transporter substrate-binding protein [Thermotogota bacterium]|nr:MAG: ABC transporter substrate binding protein [Thermotogota bacterium ADurb.Bin062]HNW46424.1 ABC transporter substrate-binding protein [Thermotogota bacterium]HOD91419.1 ABC transporter substrate-binding protein [Thermotogota bacterium]HOF24061.1 ABC transporter substrate-binding protein [Thermotogota bacterium]HOH11779.1 ABC transporter substrate-binding protein [Thermotogota bacterium]